MHVDLLVCDVQRAVPARGFEERFRERQKVFLFSVLNYQQRRFPSSKLDGDYSTNLVALVGNFASNQIADEGLSRFELRPFGERYLQLAAQERFGVIDRIDALQLEYQAAFVWPEFFQFDFASFVVLPQREQTHAGREAVGMAGVQLDGNFATTALRF